MRHIASRTVAAVVAGALTLTALPLSAAQAASPKSTQMQVAPASGTVTDISARRYRRGNPAVAIAAFGLIAGAIAASQRPDYGYYGYGYGHPAPYYGYGYRHRYNPGYRYW
jgi:hypothetical protein